MHVRVIRSEERRIVVSGYFLSPLVVVFGVVGLEEGMDG